MKPYRGSVHRDRGTHNEKGQPMALKQTYLSRKKMLPKGSETILVMRGRGNDELAPSKELLDEVNRLKKEYAAAPDPHFGNAYEYAWEKSDYERRFLAEIAARPEATERLKKLSGRSRNKDIYLICYESDDKPCHRKLLLRIAETQFGATVDHTPFEPNTA